MKSQLGTFVLVNTFQEYNVRASSVFGCPEKVHFKTVSKNFIKNQQGKRRRRKRRRRKERREGGPRKGGGEGDGEGGRGRWRKLSPILPICLGKYIAKL